jgi:serine/threonine-protein kinase
MTDPHLAPAPSIQAGNILADKYRLEYEIGRGAMGTVWSAMHVTLDQRVAIKIISREHAHSQDLRRRFSTEAKAAAKLRSRYVVGVYDDGETPEGLPYIVMEYLEGECLEDRIARNGTIQTLEAVRIAKHIGRALSRAHARGIVHRDLKPANIFITQSEDDDEAGWIAKVLDFGIAKMEEVGEKSATKTGTVLGTPLFMSPEQVRGASAVDHRADLYSLGMVVYNMITGGYAFDGSSFGDLLVSICTEPLPSMREAAPWVPESLDKWFQKACARDPQARFAHADEMIEALSEAAGTGASGRYSMVDSTVMDDALSSFAKTQAGAGIPRDVAGSHASASSQNGGLQSASPATVTVNHAPPKSKLPLILGGAGIAAAAVLVLVLASGGEPQKDVSATVGASKPTGASHPEEPKPADTKPADVVAPVAPAPSVAPSADAVDASDTTEKPAEPTSTASRTPKATSKPPKGVTKPQAKPVAATTAPDKPTAPPVKKPTSTEPDLGF